MIQVLPEGRHRVPGAAWRTLASQPQALQVEARLRMGLVSHRKTRGWGASPPKNGDRDCRLGFWQRRWQEYEEDTAAEHWENLDV